MKNQGHRIKQIELCAAAADVLLTPPRCASASHDSWWIGTPDGGLTPAPFSWRRPTTF